MSVIPVLLSAEGLSVDFSKPEKGRKVPMSKMDVELALKRLRAFAELSSIQLGDSKAKIMIARGDLRLVVTNAGSRLVVAAGKEGDGVPVEKTPEEIISWLMSVDEAKPTANKSSSKVRKGGGGLTGSLWRSKGSEPSRVHRRRRKAPRSSYNAHRYGTRPVAGYVLPLWQPRHGPGFGSRKWSDLGA